MTALLRPTSPAGAGLLRIAIPLLLWSEYGSSLLPFRRLETTHLTLSTWFFVSTAFMLLGLYGRLATAACAAVQLVMVFYFGRNGYDESWGHHHTTLLALVTTLLAAAPNSATLSLDRWFEPRSPSRERPIPLRLIGVQLSTVYFWGAFDKSHQTFLDGTRLTQLFIEGWWGSAYPFPPVMTAVFAVGAVGVVVFEYLLAFGVWVPRLRRPLLLAGALMHLLFYLTLPVGTFSLTCICCYLAYLDQDEVERALWRFASADR
jgi:hypothetical protein